MPKISVLLPVYNAKAFIAESIQSILDQTEPDFELLIVDDCSTDGSIEIIDSFKDPRIIFHKKKRNSGYTESLNWAIDQAKGEYIARMDADDVSLPNRFEKQLKFLMFNPDISICGTDAFVRGGNLIFNYPQTPKAIFANLLMGNSLIHPSIFGRSEIFKKFKYDRSKEPAEDYDLFTRLVIENKRLANIPEKLLIYRLHSEQTSEVRKIKQIQSAKRSMLQLFKYFNYDQDLYPDSLVSNAIWPERVFLRPELIQAIKWYASLNSLKKNLDIDHSYLNFVLKRKRYNLLKFCLKHGNSRDYGYNFYVWAQLFRLSPKMFVKGLLN